MIRVNSGVPVPAECDTNVIAPHEQLEYGVHMYKILVSYRREDSAPYTGRIADRLREHFGPQNVFVDIDTVKPGQDFVEVLEKSVASCDALIAVIGKTWTSKLDSDDGSRLQRNDDWVRMEVATALKRRIPVVPVLVGGAQMPKPHELPDDLLPLLRRQALEISDTRFHEDLNRLINALGQAIGDGTAVTPADRNIERSKSRRPRNIVGLVTACVTVLLIVLAYLYFSSQPKKGPDAIDAAGSTAEATGTPARPSQGSSSADAGQPIYRGQIQKFSLGDDEERLINVGPVGDTKLVLDAVCASPGACIMRGSLSIFDKDGVVIENRAISFDGYQRSYRRVHSIVLRPPKPIQLKLRNETKDPTDYWLAVVPSSESALVPFFGNQTPHSIALNESASGMLAADERTFYTLPLMIGNYVATLQLSDPVRASVILRAVLSLYDEEGGNASRVGSFEKYGASEIVSIPFDIRDPGRYIFELENGGMRVNYALKLTPK